MNALKKTQEDLQKGRQKLDDMLQRLEREQVNFHSSHVVFCAAISLVLYTVLSFAVLFSQ